MPRAVQVGKYAIGGDDRVFVIAEIGINHNGDIGIARRLIDAAVHAGCDAVKFQKRTPELCVPAEQRDQMRETPWGYITYLDYRHRVEFGEREYGEIDRYCREKNILWFASPWDEPSVDFLERFDVPCYKIPSAALTDGDLLRHAAATGRPMLLSTGMSSMPEIEAAVRLVDRTRLVLMHSTSAYPCPVNELNLRMIGTLRDAFDCPVGYSGHETGLATTVAAVALGASAIERHLTLDRSMWGSDHAASVEPGGFERLVNYVRAVEAALGDGTKRVYESEMPSRNRLRRRNTLEVS